MNNSLPNRNKIIKFKVSQEELDFIKQKAALSKAKNLSCYLRKMVITGRVINCSDKIFDELKRTVAGIGNNINQIAIRTNKTSLIYSDDIIEIKEKITEIWQLLQSIQSTLQ